MSTEEPFYISEESSGSQEALKKSRRPTALDTHAHSQLNSFVKPETFWDGMWYGVAANLTLTPVSGCGCCTYSSAVANKISPCVTSDLQTRDANLLNRRHPFEVLQPLTVTET